MILASLYTLLIMLALFTFAITLNRKEVFRDLNNASVREKTLQSKGKHGTASQITETNSAINQEIKRGGSQKQINQNATLVKEMIHRLNTDVKNIRRKRQSRNGNCSGPCKSSLCQWTETWDFDSNRNPAFIPKAKCSSQCQVAWATVLISNVINIYTACEPIKRDIPVFKNNEYTYIRDWPVSCACTIKHISSLPKKQTKVRHITKHKQMKKRGRRRWLKVKSKHKLNILKYFEISKRLMKPFFISSTV